MKNIAVLVSGGGTNLQAIINAIDKGVIQNGRIAVVVSSKPDAYALERAKQHQIETCVIHQKEYATRTLFSEAIAQVMERYAIDLIVFAGFMYILDENFVKKYENKMMNVHPALIPSFCGVGFYGLRVHQAVLEKGVKITGATVHFVNEIADGGAIILQKAVEVHEDDTPEILQKRVMEEAEWDILPQAIHLFCNDQLSICDQIVHRKDEGVS